MLNKSLSTFGITAFLLASATASNTFAQQMPDEPMNCKNQYPCAECAVFDNNGNDLKSFIARDKNDAATRGNKVIEYSGDNWGYLMVKTGAVPSVSSKWPKKGELNFTQSIRATYVMNKTKDGNRATWWARECSLPNGPMVDIKVEDEGAVELPTVRYPRIMSDLESKRFTLVEYEDSMFNARDYNVLLKNHILVAAGAISDYADYKSIIEFHDNFLSKFSSVSDPVLSTKSFITFVKGQSGTRYIAYFDQIHDELSGKLMVADIQYEKDKDVLIDMIFRKLRGKTVFIYGDDTYGMDKNIITYARTNNIKLKRRLTNMTRRFNEE
jgi:hypothetical protein